MNNICKLVFPKAHGFLFLTVLLFFALAVVELVRGQTATAPSRIAITIVSVKPDMVPDFENMIKSEYNPAIAKGGAKWSDVWQTAAFGKSFDYIFVAPIDNFAQYDGQSPLMKGLGKEGFAAWVAKASKMINGVETKVYTVREDMSYNTKMTAPPKMAVVSFVSVAPGRTAEVENFIKNDLLPVVQKSDVRGYWVHSLAFGGDVNEYLTVTLHENFAELEKGPPQRRVLGQEGAAKLMQKLPAGAIVHQERILARFNPDLSYRPAQTATK